MDILRKSGLYYEAVIPLKMLENYVHSPYLVAI